MSLAKAALLLCLISFPVISDTGLEEPLTIEKVQHYLDTHPEIKTIDDFLPHLPEAFRYRRALGFKSRSRHGASPSAPRILMLSKDASFVLAVTGRADQRNGQDIEMVQYKDGIETPWQFAEYSFSKEPSGEKRGFSGINPSLCLGCHERQGVVRPIWEPYNTWAGFFSEQNSLDFLDPRRNTPNEAAHFRTFTEAVKNDPGRFKFVFNREDLKNLSPDVVHSTLEKRAGLNPGTIRVPEDPEGDENSNLRRLSEGFNFHNFKRIHQELKKQEFYPALKWSLFAMTLGCYNRLPVDSYIPSKLKDKMAAMGQSFDAVKKESGESFNRLSQSVLERLSDPDHLGYYTADPSRVPYALKGEIALRYLMKTQNKDILNWFMTMESELGFFSVDTDQRPMFGYMLWEDIIAEAPELKREFAVQEDPTGGSNFRRVYGIAEHSGFPQEPLKFKTAQALCEELRRRSLEALANREAESTPRPSSDQQRNAIPAHR